MSDVAEKAGVSKSTVSRILNNKLGNGFSVKGEVRDRVLDIAKKMNYRPNLIAQSLTKSSMRMVHVLGGSHALSDLGNIYQTVVNNVTNALDSLAAGFDVTVDMSQHRPGSRELPIWRIDGAIILAQCSEKTMNELIDRNIPHVVINGPCKEGGFSVVPDDVLGMKLAVRHLVELGHKRIAYAGPRPKHVFGHSSIEDRHDTYVSELKKAGLQPVEGPEMVLDSAADFLESVFYKEQATAIIAYGHMEGLNLMQMAHEKGISIPRDISLISFCDEYASNVMSPGLSFIDLRSKDMGRIAAELLIKQIKSSDPLEPESIELPERLVVRKSTARVSLQQ